jgi:hypothetical protein
LRRKKERREQLGEERKQVRETKTRVRRDEELIGNH